MVTHIDRNVRQLSIDRRKRRDLPGARQETFTLPPDASAATEVKLPSRHPYNTIM